MFEKNPHGAGMAITKPDGFTEWHKGYMDLDSFMEKLNEFSPEMLKENSTTLHFRITTKGNTDPETTHPFPLSPQFSDMRKLHGITQGPVVFHNGTISGFGGIGAKVSSDSQDFVMGPMFYIMKGLKPDRNIGALRKTAIEQLIGSSRLLVMMANQDVYRFGSTWTQHTDKCYYSNMLWNPPATTAYQGYRNYTSTYSTPSSQDKLKLPSTSSASSDTTEKKQKVDNPKQPDEWGCHSYPGAWPGEGKEWIEFQSPQILEMAIKHMTTITRDGQTIYKHKESGNEYYRSGEVGLLTEKGFELMSNFYIDQYNYDDTEIAEMVKDGNISFDTLDQLSEFIELLDENSDGTYNYENEKWYADFDQLSLYTKDFLMAYFSESIEEVTQSLVTQGYIPDKLLEDDDDDIEDMTNQQKADVVAEAIKSKASA